MKKVSSVLKKNSNARTDKELKDKTLRDDSHNKKNQIKIEHIFHSCFIIKYKDKITVLTDPYFNNKATGNLKLAEKNKIKKESIPKIDLILISHEHFDHFDKDAVNYFVKRDNCIVVAPIYVTQQLNLEKNHVRTIKVDNNLVVATIKIKVVPAQHNQSFYPVGFILEKDNKSIYFAGDTISLPLITEKIDIAIMPAGGIFTSDSFKFISMARQLKCEVAIPMHYNTFDIIKMDTEKLKNRCDEKLKQCKLIILNSGESFYY